MRVKKIQDLQSVLSGLKKELQVAKEQAKEERVAKEEVRMVSESSPIGHLFLGDVLESSDEDYRKFLVELLADYSRKRIAGTRLIYQLDPLNTVNFHKYIDGKEQIVVLIKLRNGNVLGAWSQGAFSK